jgi:hypothetical protein
MEAKLVKTKIDIKRAKLQNTNLLKKQERDDIIYVVSENFASNQKKKKKYGISLIKFSLIPETKIKWNCIFVDKGRKCGEWNLTVSRSET